MNETQAWLVLVSRCHVRNDPLFPILISGLTEQSLVHSRGVTIVRNFHPQTSWSGLASSKHRGVGEEEADHWEEVVERRQRAAVGEVLHQHTAG